MNKINQLKEGVYIKSVLDYLGYPYKKAGTNYFCKCPAPGHNDKHDTNCHFKDNWHKLYCEACGASISSIDLIMYVTGRDFKEALNVLWEINGCPEWFLEKPTNSVFLNKRQRQLLNWKPNPQIVIPVGMTEVKPKESKYFIEDNIYVKTQDINVKSADFASSSEMLSILYNKCTEKLVELKNLCIELYYDNESLNILFSDLKEINDLRNKVGRKMKKELA